jgi:ABC-2 type transport system permease protein
MIRRSFVVYLKKELNMIFKGPFIYILIGLFSLISGILFFNYLMAYRLNPQGDLLNTILAPFYSNLNFILMFVAPLLTMRIFSKEKDNGTMELLLMSDLGTPHIILGKYIAVLMAGFSLLLPTLACPLVLSALGHDSWGITTGSYIGLVFTLSAYLSVGVFFSVFFDGPIPAAFGTFGTLLLSMFIFILGSSVDNRMLGDLIRYISIPFHTEPFFRGAIRTFDVIYFVTFIFSAIYLSWKIFGYKTIINTKNYND